ncbi:MAG: transglycosylase SLT domain-containing protein [Persicimonas sp.]
MSPLRVGLYVAVALALVATSATAQAEPGPDGVLPPSFCDDPECARAMHLYAGERFEEAAAAFEEAIGSVAAGESNWQARVDLLLMSASAWEQAGGYARAGLAYLKASRLHENLRPFLEFEAAENLSQSEQPDIEVLTAITDNGALDRGYAGSALVAARIDALRSDGLPSLERADAALQGSRSEDACMWLSELLVERGKSLDADKKLADRVRGRCLPEETHEGFGELSFEPSGPMRVRRADRLYRAVRFPDAYAELQEIDFDQLDEIDRCRARFRLGRTQYRLRQRTKAIGTYEKVVEECTDDENEDERVRALYAVGKMLYGRKKYDGSEKRFETLLDDYSHRTHADDAYLYLARIARDQKRAPREKLLVEKALANHPDGDMVHEIAWEHLETSYRAGDYRAFLARLGELEMPDFDGQYFSQGRLGYFAGRAWQKLGCKDKAAESWQTTWGRYPFSFYGYLSRQRVVEMGEEPGTLEAGRKAEIADWFTDSKWSQSGANRLVRLGLYAMAADVERARMDDSARSDEDRWRLAYLEHLAQRYPVSHNIARRSVFGRPWAGPEAAREVRWAVAWPNPFEDDVLRAVVAEQRQATRGQRVDPAFPTAIMREESSFIEDIESWAGALGLMQLMPRTALGHDDDIDGDATPERLKTALVNIRVGVDHLFSLARRFDNHPVLMAAAYNAGGGAVSKWLRRYRTDDIALWVEDVPYDEARNYSKRVIGSYAAYQWRSGIRDLDPAIANSPK